MRLIRHHATGASPRPRGQTCFGNVHSLPGQFHHLDARNFRLQPVHGSRNAQGIPGFRIHRFDQIPSRIQRRLVIQQSHPKGRQRAETAPWPAISTAHLNKLLNPRFGKYRGQMIGPIAERWHFTGQSWKLTFQEIAERLSQSIDIFSVAIDEIHRHI